MEASNRHRHYDCQSAITQGIGIGIRNGRNTSGVQPDPKLDMDTSSDIFPLFVLLCSVRQLDARQSYLHRVRVGIYIIMQVEPGVIQ
jgi:hypothetical protein